MGAGFDRSLPTISHASHKAKIKKHSPSMSVMLHHVTGISQYPDINRQFVSDLIGRRWCGEGVYGAGR